MNVTAVQYQSSFIQYQYQYKLSTNNKQYLLNQTEVDAIYQYFKKGLQFSI